MSEAEQIEAPQQVAELLAELTETQKASADARKYLTDKLRFEEQLDAARKFADDTQVELSQCRVGHDAIKKQLAQAKEAADMCEQENTALRDTIQQLRAKQIHDDLPGLLTAIQLAAEQMRELI